MSSSVICHNFINSALITASKKKTNDSAKCINAKKHQLAHTIMQQTEMIQKLDEGITTLPDFSLMMLLVIQLYMISRSNVNSCQNSIQRDD